jgi:hypothetical protein
MIIERSTSRMEKTITRTIVENSVMMVILFLTKKKRKPQGPPYLNFGYKIQKAREP